MIKKDQNKLARKYLQLKTLFIKQNRKIFNKNLRTKNEEPDPVCDADMVRYRKLKEKLTQARKQFFKFKAKALKSKLCELNHPDIKYVYFLKRRLALFIASEQFSFSPKPVKVIYCTEIINFEKEQSLKNIESCFLKGNAEFQEVPIVKLLTAQPESWRSLARKIIERKIK